MNYNLILPPNFQKVPLPGLNPWLAALRSGDYKQTTHWLGRKTAEQNCYCCLGVLCKVEKIPDVLNSNDHYLFAGQKAELPPEIRQYNILGNAGQLPTGCEVKLEPGINYNYLAGLNDNGLTFLQIADILEACFTHID